MSSVIWATEYLIAHVKTAMSLFFILFFEGFLSVAAARAKRRCKGRARRVKRRQLQRRDIPVAAALLTEEEVIYRHSPIFLLLTKIPFSHLMQIWQLFIFLRQPVANSVTVFSNWTKLTNYLLLFFLSKFNF